MALLKASEARLLTSFSGGPLGSPTLASAVKAVLSGVEDAALRGENTTTVQLDADRKEMAAAVNALGTLGYTAQDAGGPGTFLTISW